MKRDIIINNQKYVKSPFLDDLYYNLNSYSENSQKFEGGKWNNNYYHIYRHNQKFYKIEIEHDLNENQIVLTSCYEVQPIIESHVVYKRI